MSTVRRIELPSGGWWEIETRPRWRHVQEWRVDPGEARSGSTRGEGDLVDRMLVSLTTAWSFDLPVGLEHLADIDGDDVLAALEVLQKRVVVRWDEYDPREAAEELFAGLATGRVPDDFGEAHIMALTGWSWETLQETPADVVERMAAYLAVREARGSGGVINFAEEHCGD